MKDIYFSDKDETGEIPILTPEEIELIKQRRLQKAQGNGSFITPPDERTQSNFDVDYEYDPQEYRSFERNEPVPAPAPRKKTIQVEYDDEYDDYEEEYEEPVRQPKRSYAQPSKKDVEKAKKGCGCGCLGMSVLSIFLAIVIAFVGCFGYLLNMLGDMKVEESVDNSYVASSQLSRADGVKNILLIGLDDDQGSGTSRSDTMMLLTIDTVNNAIKLTSFLRDMWVEIPDYKKAKLNASYAHGGAQLTMDTIEYNFNVDIDNYVLVDFEMFREIVDSLGGITVEITQREADFINRTTSSVVKAGLNELDGKKALIYARIRKLDSDFYRTMRQRKVISAIIEKIKEINPLELVGIVKDILPMITTDLKPLSMIFTAVSALGCLNIENIQQLQIPADDAYVSKSISGQAALVPDLDKNIENLKEFIYGEIEGE
ncbi:MAG: LCP family protein [Clostridia bacterium]|nr:LCP family protein [Clostridia bacterium]